MSALFRLLRSRLNPPKPSHASFIGQTILITAASGGLGLEAAKHLAAQGTSTLIITARDEKKGAAAKAAIEAHLKTFSPNPNKSINILTLVLEMSDPSSIHAFIDALKSHTTHLDQAILNAGLVQAKHTMSSGYETTIRVNTISTTLLGLLLLPLLLASRLTTQQSISSRPHLSFISSGTAWLFTGPEKWRPYSNDANPVAALSKAEAFPPGRMGGQAEYATSKLLLEMSIRKIAFLPSLLSDPSDPKSEPKVLVTSTCPGMCRSDLGRQYTGQNPVFRLLVAILFFTIARSATDGANTYLTSLEQGIEARGEMWKDDRIWNIEGVEKNIRSKEAREVQERVWREMKGIVVKEDGTGVVTGLLGEGKKGQ